MSPENRGIAPETLRAVGPLPPMPPLARSAVLVIILMLCFVFLASEMMEGDLARFDTAVLMAFRTAGNDPIGPAWLQETGRDVTALGSFAFLGFLFAATTGYLLLIGKRGLALLMVAAVLGGVVVSMALKLGFDRPRPDIPHTARVFTASFPSGHATLSAIPFLTLGALLTRATADRHIRAYFMTLAVILTVAVGISRIYLAVHYPSDVLAGWCVGSAWAVLCWTIGLRLQQRDAVEVPASAASMKRMAQ